MQSEPAAEALVTLKGEHNLKGLTVSVYNKLLSLVQRFSDEAECRPTATSAVPKKERERKFQVS